MAGRAVAIARAQEAIVKLPTLLTPRAVSRLTRVPWQQLRRLLEVAGYRVYRIAGRERVAEADLAALIESAKQPTLAEAADRIGLAIDLAAAEMGIARRSRRRRGDRHARPASASPETMTTEGVRNEPA